MNARRSMLLFIILALSLDCAWVSKTSGIVRCVWTSRREDHYTESLRWIRAYVVNSPELQLAPTESGSSEDAQCLLACDSNPKNFGLWAPTSVEWDCRIHLIVGSITEDKMRAARSQFIGIFENKDVSRIYVAEFKSTNSIVKHIIWSGYFHNTGTAMLFCAACYMGVLELRTYLRVRRKKAGCCEKCGYPLVGLRTNTCPECGVSNLN